MKSITPNIIEAKSIIEKIDLKTVKYQNIRRKDVGLRKARATKESWGKRNITNSIVIENNTENFPELTFSDEDVDYNDIVNSTAENLEILAAPLLVSSVSNIAGKRKREEPDYIASKRGRYVSPNPAIDLVNQKPQGKYNNFADNILNGCVKAAHKVDGIRYSLANTCPSDSLTESFAVGYVNSTLFQNFVDKCNTDKFSYYNNLSYYSKHGPNAEFYGIRDKFLLSIYPPDKNNVIDCTDYLSATVGKLMAPHPS